MKKLFLLLLCLASVVGSAAFAQTTSTSTNITVPNFVLPSNVTVQTSPKTGFSFFDGTNTYPLATSKANNSIDLCAAVYSCNISAGGFNTRIQGELKMLNGATAMRDDSWTTYKDSMLYAKVVGGGAIPSSLTISGLVVAYPSVINNPDATFTYQGVLTCGNGWEVATFDIHQTWINLGGTWYTTEDTTVKPRSSSGVASAWTMVYGNSDHNTPSLNVNLNGQSNSTRFVYYCGGKLTQVAIQ